MNKTWNESVRNSLKSASDCNEYFDHDGFQEGSFPIKIPLEFAQRIDKSRPLRSSIVANSSQGTQSSNDFLDSPVSDERAFSS